MKWERFPLITILYIFDIKISPYKAFLTPLYILYLDAVTNVCQHFNKRGTLGQNWWMDFCGSLNCGGYCLRIDILNLVIKLLLFSLLNGKISRMLVVVTSERKKVVCFSLGLWTSFIFLLFVRRSLIAFFNIFWAFLMAWLVMINDV